MLEGLSSLKQLEKLVLSDNLLSCACLDHLTSLTALQQLDLSVMPSISRMRSSSKADLHALGKLTALQELNIIGFGVRDAVVVSQLTRLTHLEAGLNPLSAASLQVRDQPPWVQRRLVGCHSGMVKRGETLTGWGAGAVSSWLWCREAGRQGMICSCAVCRWLRYS